jgi:hypothetical protein
MLDLRDCPYNWSHEDTKHHLSGTNHGEHATPSERACHGDAKNWTINWDISSQPPHQTKRTSFNERTHVQPSVRIENLE